MSKLFRPKEYHRPKSLAEAVSLLNEKGGVARVIAGGTDLLVERPVDVECVVDINLLPLNYIRADAGSGLAIGALMRIHSIETCGLFDCSRFRVFRVLAEAAASIGYRSTRNMGTIGGNLCNAVPSADLPPVLIALDAEVQIEGSEGRRTVPLEEFHLDVRKTVLKRGELLTEVKIRGQPSLTGVAFCKLGRLRVDIAQTNTAARVTLAPDGSCDDVRIVLGAMASTPMRALEAEKLFKDRVIDSMLLHDAAQSAASESRPISDVRASADYRRETCEIMVKRVLRRAFERAKEG